MQQRKLGNLSVSSLGLGCMGMSEFYGATNDAASTHLIHRAVDLGVTLFDTADMYGMGHNEILIGKALVGRRNQVIIASKCGIVRNSTDPKNRSVNGSPAYIKKSCEASLKRLHVDTIDLYYLHRMDLNVPIEESVGALADLVKEGKIRFIGLSEASAELIRRGHVIHPITAIQSEFSVLSRQVQKNHVLETCQNLGIGFVAYSPLSRALLSNDFKTMSLQQGDFRKNMPRFQAENLSKNIMLVDEINIVAKEKGCSVAQLSLAWLLHQAENIIPIPGTKQEKYLLENIAAVDIKFKEPELSQINSIFEKLVPFGERYAKELLTTYHMDE